MTGMKTGPIGKNWVKLYNIARLGGDDGDALEQGDAKKSSAHLDTMCYSTIRGGLFTL